MSLIEIFECTISRHPSAAHGARDAVRGELERLGCAERVPAAQLAVTELVENVVAHTDCRGCRMVVSASDERVRVAIVDCEPDEVARNLPGGIGSLQPGMGLRLVDAMTDDWGCDADLFHKTVWFEFRRPAVHG